MEPISAPAAEYDRRLAARRARTTRLDRRSAEISNLRLSTFLVLAVLVWLAIRGTIAAVWIAAPVAIFLVLIFLHERILRRLTESQRAAGFYEHGLARIADAWDELGRTGEQFRNPEHVYAEDLDLFGRHSLFQLLSVARTNMGESTLADWLLRNAPLPRIRQRQQAIAELKEKIDFREALAVCGDQMVQDFDPAKLIAWAEGPELLHDALTRIAALVLALAAIASIVMAFWKQMYYPIAAVILIESVILMHLGRRVSKVIDSVEGSGEPLLLFSTLLVRIEQERFASPLLQSLQSGLRSASISASRALKKFSSLVDFIEARHNVVLRILNVPLLYDLQIAFAVEAWRRTYGKSVRTWLDAIGIFEALNSLAAYAYEHPDDPFPEFAEEADACFYGESLGHPLIAQGRCVRNSVYLNSVTRVLLVSGSNMSGKSTYLRTIGLNAVLAMAGAPVRAKSLRLSPLQIGSSLHVMDSLQSGRSGFASELYRLRQIMELTDAPPPVLFLLDELLHGTNSRDRHVGGEALLKSLVAKGAIGVVTTHDLSLTNVPADLMPTVHNAHFEDRMEDRRMVFDYVLREGVVAKSNALELMRAIGLDV